MSFSPSTFTLEINGKPMLVFQTKWQVDADELCRDWVKSHWAQLVSKDRYGNDVPPILKIRMARSTEKSAYDAAAESAEPFRDVKVVGLAAATEQPNETHDGGKPDASDDPQAS
ncbi:hypothetical protein [Bradyrhizobium erythrophlei]|nr:hypothetical protein [Bradyrhizobium erythrophlei]